MIHDTEIVFYAKTWDEVKVVTENGIRIVSDWVQRNHLTLNVDNQSYQLLSHQKAA